MSGLLSLVFQELGRPNPPQRLLLKKEENAEDEKTAPPRYNDALGPHPSYVLNSILIGVFLPFLLIESLYLNTGRLLSLAPLSTRLGAAPSFSLAETVQAANNILFCPSQEKFHTVILRGVRQYF